MSQQMLLEIVLPIAIVAVIGVAITLIVFYFINRPTKPGYMPKHLPAKIKRFAVINSFDSFEDITIKVDEQLYHADNLVIGSFGVCVIQTKDISGDIYGTPAEERWLCVNNDKRKPFENPVNDAKKTAMGFARFFKQNGVHNCNAEYMIIFPYDAELSTSSKLPVYTYKDINEAFKKLTYLVDKNVDIDKLKKAIEENKI